MKLANLTLMLAFALSVKANATCSHISERNAQSKSQSQVIAQADALSGKGAVHKPAPPAASADAVTERNAGNR